MSAPRRRRRRAPTRGAVQSPEDPAPHDQALTGRASRKATTCAASRRRRRRAEPDGGLTVAYFAATSTSLEAQASATSRLASAVPTVAQPPLLTASLCS